MKARIGYSSPLLLLVILAVSFGCISQGTNEVIKIGSILGLTGDNASYGQKMLRGFELARDEINGQGGIQGKAIKLLVEDSQFDPTRSVSAFQKLTAVEDVGVLVGITGSRNAIPVCQAAKNDDVVIVDALSSAPKISTQCGPNYFRIMASDALAGQYNVEWALESSLARPAIIYVEDDWGTSYRDSVVKYLTKKDVRSVAIEGVTAGTRDFRVQVEKMRQAAPDTIFLLLYAKEGASFMQQLRQARVNVHVYGSDNISSAEFASAGNETIEGVRVAMPASVHGPKYEEFAGRYRLKFDEEPDASVIKSYDALMLAASVIKDVGMKPSQVIARLAAPDFEYRGVSGLIRFDQSGDLVSQEYTRMVYADGKLVPVR